MTRVPVPDDYERGHISVAGAKDYHYGQADVNLDDVDRARDASVQEDDAGRFVGVNANYADEVAAFLGVTVDGAESSADATEENTDDGPDADEADESGDEAASVGYQIENGECPWCDEYDGDAVPQHASSAHPDEWAAYKED